MKNDTFANRLKKALKEANITQTDLAKKTNIDKSLINKYLKGIAEAGNDNLSSMANVLNVNEVWLMGYDVPINTDSNENKVINDTFDELEILFDKHKDILTEDDKEYIKFIIEKRKKEIDKELGED